METNRTAILLFTHDAENEVKNKCFLNHTKQKVNRKIAESLIKNSIKKVSSLGLPYFIVSTKDQIGSTFGERLSNSVSSIFDKGFDKVLVTGSDIPTITTSLFHEASELLNRNDFVIGPTLNGGTYFIGLTKTCFNESLFKNLNWQTGSLLSEIIDFAHKISSSVVITEPLKDINNGYDLKYFVENNSICSSIARTIARYLGQLLTSIFSQKLCNKTSIPFYSFGITAPPVV